MSGTTVYRGARVFTADPSRPWASAIAVRGERLLAVGDDRDVLAAAGRDAKVVECDGGLVLPGFVDAHAHVLMTGEAQLRADLTTAGTLQEIQRRLTAWVAQNPSAPRVLGRSWLFSAVPGGRPARQMLDEVVPDRPVYLDANDYHSVWVNSSALAELGIDRSTPDPVGGLIERDSAGEPTGHLVETAAQTLAWPFLADAATDEDRHAHLRSAVRAYTSSGVTTAVDMAMDQQSLAAMDAMLRADELDLRVVGHWFIHRAQDVAAQVAEAAILAKQHASPRLRIIGVKFIVDGVIDGCTAAMLQPYHDGRNAEPIWPADDLVPAVVAADAAGMQIALHAIGDRTIRIALDALEEAQRVNPPRERRHRIEHLEYVDRADVPRLAALGVTASMQPVHADPAIQENWRAMLGDERVERGYPWPEMTGSGATLAFGTDAPTAPHPPLRNMFIAATRKSAIAPALPPNVPGFALPLADAVAHGTRDAAWASFGESDFGRLATGLSADLVVVDRDPFRSGPESLLDARVVRTVVGGRTVHG